MTITSVMAAVMVLRMAAMMSVAPTVRWWWRCCWSRGGGGDDGDHRSGAVLALVMVAVVIGILVSMSCSSCSRRCSPPTATNPTTGVSLTANEARVLANVLNCTARRTKAMR
jgi:hypothetical protein